MFPPKKTPSKFIAAFTAAILALALNLLAIIAPSNSAEAADLSLFNAGNIIDDAVFYDGNAMSASEIQAFLNSKVPTCYVSVCLKNYREDTSKFSMGVQYDDNGSQICTGYAGVNSETAAQIIAKVGKSCSISQKVLLVLLQKEQSLVTSASPSSASLSAATGYACYDNDQPCQGGSAGFFKQIWSAAKQFRNYQTFTWFPVGKPSEIRYQAANTEDQLIREGKISRTCGKKLVTIENKATAALYYYTPYTPNAALLSGNPDYCSAYGNYNFFVLFQNWGWETQLPKAAIYAKDSSGALWLYRGNSKGGWISRVQVGSGWQSLSNIIDAGDFNSDGFRDLIALDSSRNLKLYPTDGGVKFGTVKTIATGISAELILAPGDLDENGTNDILTVDQVGDVWLYRGNGSSSLLLPKKVATGWGNNSIAMGAGDWNRDGHLDVIVRNNLGKLLLYPGNGSGGFFPFVQIGSGWSSMTAITNFGDYSGDGISDIAARTDTGNLMLYRGNGAGGFLPGATKIGSGWKSMVSLSGAGLNTTKKYVEQVGSGDLNLDGKKDILALNSRGELVLFKGSGRSSIIGSQTFPINPLVPKTLKSIGDINLDGLTEVAWKNSDNQLQVVSVDRNGFRSQSSVLGSGWVDVDTFFNVGDFDSDGFPDIMARNSSGKLLLYPGNSAGTLGAGVQVGSGWGSMKKVFGAGDFDGDSNTDVLAVNSTGKLMLYRGNGNRGWYPPEQVGSGWTTYSSVFSPGDLSGDGKPDIVAKNSTGKLILYPGDGFGGWKPSVQIGSGFGTYSLVQ